MKSNSSFRSILLIALVVSTITLYAQPQQIGINRISQMPDLPSPYMMRDWKTVALNYDAFIFNTLATGQHLPVIHIGPTGVNYPVPRILLDSYVGSASAGQQAEAINIIPALVGGTLSGLDKSSQNGINWTLKAREFFNKANGQNVYLNGYSATSGSDWWYDVMPNVFFYQLYSQYPETEDFDEQLKTVASRWRASITAMGGSATPWTQPEMNYRGWRLSTMTPNASGVTEPEAAGGIAWILYHAWIATGDDNSLSGAQMAMDFLDNQTENPSYELQMPYGAFIAAKMNAELGTSYDVEKMVNWCFDRNSRRGWGAIVGRWNNADVSGLIGEANNTGNDYAFAMNGFQQAAALVPMVKYDKRFAHDVAKWVLNVANASRLFYAPYLAADHQDDHSWSVTNDPGHTVAYEALKENWTGKALYATGDAKRLGWAQTNLALYGSSHVGYLAAIVAPTDVDGILKLDLNKTDFFGLNARPANLVYNPYPDTKTVTVKVSAVPIDIYDAISEQVVRANASGNITIDIPGDGVMLLVELPAGSTLTERDGMLYESDNVVDYHYGYHFDGKFRIKSLAAKDSLVAAGQQEVIYSTIENAAGTVTYTWHVNGEVQTPGTNNFTWTASPTNGNYTIKLTAHDGAKTVSDSIVLKVVSHIPKPPEIIALQKDSLWYYEGQTITLICKTVQQDGDVLQYVWTPQGGSIVSQQDSLVRWKLPVEEGVFSIECKVTNMDNLSSTASVLVLVKDPVATGASPFAWFPLDGNANDVSGNGRHATLVGATTTDDVRGESAHAFHFASGNDVIKLNNDAASNFRDRITLSAWIKADVITEESFILSHGSWEERWKVSVTPTRKLRWTVKTSGSTVDVDNPVSIEMGRFYHFAAVYTGHSAELYINGVMKAFSRVNGLMGTTANALTIGVKDASTKAYSFHGTVDEVRIYDKALSPDEIKVLPTLWNLTTGLTDPGNDVVLYPNPSTGIIHISCARPISDIKVSDVSGRNLDYVILVRDVDTISVALNVPPGMVIVRVELDGEVLFRKVIIK